MPRQPRELLDSAPADERPEGVAERPPGTPTSAIRLPPWIQLVGLPLLVVFALLFARAASHAVVVFLIAGIISMLLNPVVRAISRGGVPRLASVLFVFGSFVTLVTLVSLASVDVLAHEARSIQRNSAVIASGAVERIDSIQEFLDDRDVEIDLRDQGVKFVEQLQERSTEVSTRAVEFTSGIVTWLAEVAFNMVLIIVITIYMLLDAPRIGRLFASLLPDDSGVEVLFGRMERSLLRYVVGQSLASLVMGVSATVGLWIIGWVGLWESADEYAVLFGIIVAVTEFAPSIGPFIGSIPPIVTALFTDGVVPALVMVAFFLLLHQIEGHIVIPKLMGAAIAVHPLLVIFGILAGAQIMGVGGILLAIPMLALLREIGMYIRERVVLGSWGVTSAGAVLAGQALDSAARGGEAVQQHGDGGAGATTARSGDGAWSRAGRSFARITHRVRTRARRQPTGGAPADDSDHRDSAGLQP